MRQTSFENFIRFGGSTSITLKASYRHGLEVKQATASASDVVGTWVDGVWSGVFRSTLQIILRFRKTEGAEPPEFSVAGLSDIDQEKLRAEATNVVRSALDREGVNLSSAEWEQRAHAVLSGFLNQALQEAMGIEFYVWQTQNDLRVRGSHAERDDKIFRWDAPPEGGHPTQDFGCRCYAQPLGIESYWDRVGDGVEAFISDLAQWEGNIDHMYLDSADNVTVGQGTLLPNTESAVALAFRDRESDLLATPEDISEEFSTVDSMDGSPDVPASAYGPPVTHLYLPQGEIGRLVTEHVRGDFDALLLIFPYFGNLPLSAQVAIWDMVYNLGPTRFEDEFPRLRQAIEMGDWAEAAEQSHRIGPSEERNQYVFDLFMQAADAP